MKKSTKFIFASFVTIFILSIFSIAALNYVVADNDYSETENRSLASFPTLNWQNVFDGSFMEDFETYFSDQFVFRDLIVQLKSNIDLIFGQKEANEVLIGDDGFLFEMQSEFDFESVSQLTTALTEFSNNYGSIEQAFVLSPNASLLYEEFLPYGYENDSQVDQLKEFKAGIDDSSFSWISARNSFANLDDDTQLFYKTDHHWTTAAAFSVFETLAEKWGLEYDEDYYEFYTVSTNFQGTMSSKSGITSSYDTIEICVPSDSVGSYIVEFVAEDSKTNTLFFDENLDTVNQYEVFLGGNYEEVIITTTSMSDDTLLIVKDSYANCLIPMLTPYFSTIVIIDPRYGSEDLNFIMQDFDFTHMLFVYNLNTLLEDTSLIGVLN
ncbi:MAG: DHHW family protein [Clostridia bacterium]